MRQTRRLLAIALLLGVWQFASTHGGLNPFILPPPSQVFTGLARLAASGELLGHALASLRRVLIGYGFSVCTAIPLGLLLGLNSGLKYYLNPVLSLLRPIPPIAWIPLTILWFGLGNGPSYFITMISSFFPLLMNTMTGVENVDRRHLDVARSLGARPKMILFEVILPSAAPFILSGMRIGMTVAWMSVVAAEMVSATQGLGYFIEMKQEMVQTDMVLSGMLTIAMIGVGLDFLLLKAKKQWVRWPG